MRSNRYIVDRENKTIMTETQLTPEEEQKIAEIFVDFQIIKE